MRRFFQIRSNDKIVDQHFYASLHEASRALVERNDPRAEIVELDTPGGAVVRKLTFSECEKILGSSSRRDE